MFRKVHTWLSHGSLTRYKKMKVVHAREWQEPFPRYRLQRKPLVSDAGVHHGTWCMSGSPTRGGGENVHGSRGACATRIFMFLTRCPCFVSLWFILIQWLLGRLGNFTNAIFKLIDIGSNSCEIGHMSATEIWWWVNIGSDNGLVTSGNKPLPVPMLTHPSVTRWGH